MLKKNKNYSIAKNANELAEMIGLDSSHALDWTVRQFVTNQIIANFKEQNLNITALSLDAETSRGRVTKILKRDTQGISLDVLFRILSATGQRKILLKFPKVG